MGRTSAVATLVAAFWVLAPAAVPASAQTLETGTWTGNITGPDGEMVAVEFDVAVGSDGLEITLMPPPEAGDVAPFPFEELSLEDAVLSFVWYPGPRIECSLERNDDGSFEGPCTDPEGDTGFITMVPPAFEAR